MDIEDEEFPLYPESPRISPILNPTNSLDEPPAQLGRRTQPIDILAQVAATEAAQEGASRTEAAEQTSRHMTIVGLVQRAAKAAKNRAGVQGSVSSVIARIKYLYHAKWIPPLNIDDALDELQSSSGWTAPTTSTQPGSQNDVDESIASSRASTSPPFETYLSEDRPPNPAHTQTPQITITTNNDGSDSEDSLEAEIAAHARGRAGFSANNEQHPYLEIGDHQPAWPTPPPSPSSGSDTQPPKINCCGSSPGEDWNYNDITKLNYYRYLIPSPETGKFVVAPWIKFDLFKPRPEVSATFGRHHPEYTKVLRPTAVDYDTDTISPEQARIFHTEEPFAPAVDVILSELCPPDLEAGIRHYRYYRTVTRAYQNKARDAQELHMKYLERMMEVLDTLEKADAFNRLAVLVECAKHSTIPNPEAFHALSSALEGLPRRDDDLSDRRPPTPPLRSVDTWHQSHRLQWASLYKAEPTNDNNNNNSSSSNDTRVDPIAPLCTHHKVFYYKPCRLGPRCTGPLHTPKKASSKQCYKCHGVGHVRQQCPNNVAVPWHLRFPRQ